MVFTRELHVHTAGHTDVHDITLLVQAQVSDSGLRAGIVTVFCPGSTGGLTTIEYESGVVADLQEALETLAPEERDYGITGAGVMITAAHTSAPALVGPSLTVPFVAGRLTLGTWQQIVFLDFDTIPRQESWLCR